MRVAKEGIQDRILTQNERAIVYHILNGSTRISKEISGSSSEKEKIVKIFESLS
jgi:hypothetical protein